MSELFYGDGPQGKLLSEVHTFLELESTTGTIKLEGTNFIPRWDSDPDIFGAPIGLENVAFRQSDQGLKLQVASLVLDDGDTKLTLDASKVIEEESSTSDPFVDYFVSQFIPRIVKHPHSHCVREAIRVRQLQAQRVHPIATLRAAKTGQVIIE